MVTHGFGCGTPNCKGVLHQNCYDNYRRRNSNCPTCGGNWGPVGKSTTNKSVMPIGEAAYRDGQDKLKRRVRRSEGDDDDDDDEEAEDGEEVQYEEEPPSQPQPSEPQPSRTQKKRLSKRRAVQDDGMEVDGGDEDDDEEIPTTQAQPRRRSSRR